MRAANPKGFGLLQRNRSWSEYADLEALYEQRPSYWVEPRGEWGAGQIELVELRTEDEGGDNIVAFWRPDQSPQRGETLEFAYRLQALMNNAKFDVGGIAQRTFNDDLPDIDGKRRSRFIIDFNGGELAFWLRNSSEVELVVDVWKAELFLQKLRPNEKIKGFRATVEIGGARNVVGGVRAFLRAQGHALTETWTTTWLG